MASTGFKFAGTGASVDTGADPWTSPGNVTADDNANASTPEGAADATSDTLRATNFGFAVPAGATIDGIEVRYRRFNDGSKTIATTNLRLVKSGVSQGSAKTPAGNWEATETANTQGGAADLWGATPTDTDVNASGWGVDIWLLWDGALPLSGGAKADSVEMNVHYTEASSGDLTMMMGVS